MRFMIFVKATPQTEAEGPGAMPDQQLMADMAGYHEALAKAGVLLDGAGLRPSRLGWRIHYGAGDRRTVTDGPFAESKEVVAGYTLIQVRSREEALEWARRFPNPMGRGQEADIEVRQLYELEDFGDTEQTRRLRKLGMG
ncbi:YciI family protein [Caenimonas terrae]|uniref:YciI family protein n=1 Tax=Caenimonas terrae TaxID=696074 RepID=A0ABW0N8K3_9BURK